MYDIGERLKDQELDGVNAEVIYPSVLFDVYQVEDTDVVVATFQAYNDWLYEYMKPAPKRLFGLGAANDVHQVADNSSWIVVRPAAAPRQKAAGAADSCARE